MRKYHRYEFLMHYKKKLALLLTTSLSLAFVLVFEVMILYTALCQQSLLFENEQEAEAFYDNNGFCSYFMMDFTQYFVLNNNIGVIFWLVDFAIIVPVITFFLLD